MSTHPSRPTPAPHTPAATVVAGLVPHGDPHEVARAAVAEAERRGCRVTFVQVLPPGMRPEERADADDLTFHAALRAMHGRSKVSFTFETITGDAGDLLVDRSEAASLLVVGADACTVGPAVAQWCQEHAHCEVLTVAKGAGPHHPGERTAGDPPA